MVFQRHSKETPNFSTNKQNEQSQSERTKMIMAQYTNSTPNSNNWDLYFQPSPYGECLVVLLILLYGLKIQLQKPNHRRNVKLIQEFQRGVVHLLNTLMNWCAHMQDFDDAHIEKHVINVKVVPYENKTNVKLEKKIPNLIKIARRSKTTTAENGKSKETCKHTSGKDR